MLVSSRSLFILLLSSSVYAQGTMSTDETQASKAEASLSGTAEDSPAAQRMEEEVHRKDEEDYINEKKLFPNYDPQKIEKDEEQYPSVNGI